MPEGDKGGSRTAIGFDLELLGGTMLPLLRQAQGEQVCGSMISVRTFRASGLTTCGQTALSCVPASSGIFMEVAGGAVCPGMSGGGGGRDEIYAGLCSWGQQPRIPLAGS